MPQGYKLVTRKVTDLKGGAAQEKFTRFPITTDIPTWTRCVC